MDDLDALLADLETTTSHISKRPVLLTDSGGSHTQERTPVSKPATSSYNSQAGKAVMSVDPIPASTLQGGSDKEHLYSTVCKPLSPKAKEAAPPPFSSSSGVLGAGLCELDRLLQELNATQFNITDEIMSQFPSSKSPATDKDKERLEDSTDGTSLSRSTTSPSAKPTATSATLELDKLMASLSDFRVQSNVVTALGSTWHPEHFVCTYCQKEMGGSNFFEKDGAPYCERDYFQLFSPRCGFCNEPILDKMVTALDKNWHPEHFCCVKCRRPFGEEGFHEKDGKQYCRQDFYELFSTRCQGCSQAILENYISALNALWHPECFVCRECYTPFMNGSFFEHGGRPFCEIHYHKQRGSLCSGCEKPITGRCITAMGRKFHPEHFVCAFCLKQLNKGTFKEQNEKPYCHPCFIKLFG
ncbi:transforming growth factor beta-1-induced transcript 1 protein isoform X2 [Pseudonaja textilis]|uniref:transforming growth factor beta-1-induced transcript 1 protein isoform X2 n=1 Tax=Pseudonaja textilis TaxID=8673 RepID=UPI000EAA9930|nr:transforming growth factor beta-1-induced transcript 1 protein isoform X2 [Pseudonaja textilis]